jgi:hypothetical protein
MIPVKTFPGMGQGGLRRMTEGGEFNYNIL